VQIPLVAWFVKVVWKLENILILFFLQVAHVFSPLSDVSIIPEISNFFQSRVSKDQYTAIAQYVDQSKERITRNHAWVERDARLVDALLEVEKDTASVVRAKETRARGRAGSFPTPSNSKSRSLLGNLVISVATLGGIVAVAGAVWIGGNYLYSHFKSGNGNE
jgi:hypothetical protein